MTDNDWQVTNAKEIERIKAEARREALEECYEMTVLWSIEVLFRELVPTDKLTITQRIRALIEKESGK